MKSILLAICSPLGRQMKICLANGDFLMTKSKKFNLLHKVVNWLKNMNAMNIRNLMNCKEIESN